MFNKENTQAGIFLLYICIVTSMIILLMSFSINKYSILEFSFYLINAMLVYLVQKGKNWARFLLGLAYMSFVPFFLGPIGQEFARLRFIGICKLGLLALTCYAIILLLKKESIRL